MVARAIVFLASLLVCMAFFPASADADSTLRHEPAGSHWKAHFDRGYFRIYNLDESVTVGLRNRPSLQAPVLKPLRQGDIVASDGITHWGAEHVWQRINSAQTDGWVPKRYLKRARPQMLRATTLPVAGSCVGYAPVWSLRWAEKSAFLSLFPGQVELTVDQATATEEGKASLLEATSATLVVELLHTGEACSRVRGSSSAGMTGYLVVTESTGKRLLTGCCETAEEAFPR